MNKGGHIARKRFGQNFLTDTNIIHRIQRAIAPDLQDYIIEIGPGQGALTEALLDSGATLNVIEIDRDLASMLRAQYLPRDNFTLHEADVLKFDFSTLETPATGARIIGNLPYNISTPLIFHLLKHCANIRDMIFMLQLEVVERLAAGVGDPHYGRLGIMVQYYCQVEKLFRVPPEAFNPRPKVDSAIVRLSPHKVLPFPARNVKMLERVVREAFNKRRKTIRNSLKNLMRADEIESLGIDASLRPEALSLQEYVRISDHLNEASD